VVSCTLVQVTLLVLPGGATERKNKQTNKKTTYQPITGCKLFKAGILKSTAWNGFLVDRNTSYCTRISVQLE